MHRFTPVELALGFALAGSVFAVAVPTFAREIHLSRLVEPEDGLARLGADAMAYADARGRLPDSAPLTPPAPPRGKKDVDPPGTWSTPAWAAVDFRPVPEGTPHAFAFEMASTGAHFVARSRGDLDGDGVLSLFEIRAEVRPGAPATLDPGMYVEAELE